VKLHRNAQTTPTMRALIVQRIRQDQWPPAEAAAAAGISVRTTYKWLRRVEVRTCRRGRRCTCVAGRLGSGARRGDLRVAVDIQRRDSGSQPAVAARDDQVVYRLLAILDVHGQLEAVGEHCAEHGDPIVGRRSR
jgi:hypothetical protein